MDAQPNTLTAVWMHSLPLFSYPEFGPVWPRYLPKINEARAGKPSIGTDCHSGVPGLWQI